MAAALVIYATQGETVTTTVQAQDAAGASLTGFAPSDGLAATIWPSMDSSVSESVTPTWASASAGTVSLTIDDTITSSLSPGVYSVSIYLDDGSTILRKLYLALEGSPGSVTYRSLATLADCQALIPGLYSTETLPQTLPIALEAATNAIEGYCRRKLVLTDFDRIYRPELTRKINLHSWPVPSITRISVDPAAVISIECNATTNQVATVKIVPTSPQSNQLAKLIFYRMASGTPTTQEVANYSTLTSLVASINALGGGWSASVIGDYGSLHTSEIIGTVGTYSGFGGLKLHAYTRDLTDYILDPFIGTVELLESRSEAFRFPDRIYPYRFSEPRYSGVRCRYRAGYAVSAADISAGYDPVPGDLKAACVMTAQSILESASAASPVIKQSVKDRSYEISTGYNLIPQAARLILGRYENPRIF